MTQRKMITEPNPTTPYPAYNSVKSNNSENIQLVMIHFFYAGVEYQSKQVVTLNENNELTPTRLRALRSAMRNRLLHLGFLNKLDETSCSARSLGDTIKDLRIVVII